MQEIAKRVWKEPAVAIGLATTVVLAILAVVTGAPWDASVIVGIIAPFASSLGIRGVVSPSAAKQDDAKPPPAPPPEPTSTPPETPPPADHDESVITPGDPTV